MMKMPAGVREVSRDPQQRESCLSMIHEHQEKAGIPPTFELLGRTIWHNVAEGSANTAGSTAVPKAARLPVAVRVEQGSEGEEREGKAEGGEAGEAQESEDAKRQAGAKGEGEGQERKKGEEQQARQCRKGGREKKAWVRKGRMRMIAREKRKQRRGRQGVEEVEEDKGRGAKRGGEEQAKESEEEKKRSKRRHLTGSGGQLKEVEEGKGRGAKRGGEEQAKKSEEEKKSYREQRGTLCIAPPLPQNAGELHDSGHASRPWMRDSRLSSGETAEERGWHQCQCNGVCGRKSCPGRQRGYGHMQGKIRVQRVGCPNPALSNTTKRQRCAECVCREPLCQQHCNQTGLCIEHRRNMIMRRPAAALKGSAQGARARAVTVSGAAGM